MGCFLLRSPDGLFSGLTQFLDRRCLAHLDETEKCEHMLDLLIYLLEGTYNPFVAYFDLHEDENEKYMNWTSKIRQNEKENVLKERCKHIFKALIKKNVLKIMRA